MVSFFYLVWFALCILVGVFANVRRNRSGLAWFCLAFFCTPLLAGILVAILREKPSAVAVFLNTVANNPARE